MWITHGITVQQKYPKGITIRLQTKQERMGAIQINVRLNHNTKYKIVNTTACYSLHCKVNGNLKPITKTVLSTDMNVSLLCG